jgi:hypothetical protein
MRAAGHCPTLGPKVGFAAPPYESAQPYKNVPPCEPERTRGSRLSPCEWETKGSVTPYIIAWVTASSQLSVTFQRLAVLYE